MNNVSTSSKMIIDAISLCNGAIQTLSATQRKMQSDYHSAESEWSDAKYRQLGEIVNDCSKEISQTIEELNRCLVPLKAMEQHIREYEETNLMQNFHYTYASADSGAISPNNDIISQTPINNGNWSGDRGNSVWLPHDEEVLRDLRYYGSSIEGIEYLNGYPDFAPVQVFESRLSVLLYDRDDDYQFTDCNLELLDFLNNHPDLISYFDDTQLSEIARGQNPRGYTWHHDVQSGRMQLVPTSIHRNCPHYGGRNRWGGGTANR